MEEKNERASEGTITLKKSDLWKYSTFVLGALVIVMAFVAFSDDNSGVTGNSSIKIFHNTFYGLGWYGIWVTGGNSQGSVIFRNNIIHAQRTILLTRFNSEGNVDSDYNCFYTANGTPQFQLFNSTTSKTYYNLSSWQTTGFDNHSVYGDPIFTSGPNLNSSSPCKNMGADVSSMIGFPYKDYYGTTIPQGSAPDIGAVEG